MKSLKVVRAFTVLITVAALGILIPFGYFKNTFEISYALQFSFKFEDLVPYFKLTEKLDLILKIIQYGAIATAGFILFAWFFTFLKSQKGRSTFTAFGAIASILAMPIIILKMVLLNNTMGFDWVVGGSIMAFNFIDLFIAISNDVASKIKSSSVTQTIYQTVQQGAGASTQSDSYNASELSDSLAARQRIELLKSGLSIPSYDDALEEIDATGSWNGLNMADVKEFNIEDEIRRNEQMRSMKQYGTNTDTTSSLKN
jgi:hypothetical protein